MRLAASIERLSSTCPPDAASVKTLSPEDEERLDAFLFRFSSFAAIVHDQVGRALLIAEEENLATASRKDQRLLLEKLGAGESDLAFGVVVELWDRLAHCYPDDGERPAEVMNMGAGRADDLLAAHNGMLAYALKFGVGVGLDAVIPATRRPGPG